MSQPKAFKMKEWHKDFCRKYLEVGRNGTEAFLQVRPNAKYGSARASSCALLKYPEIQAEIKKQEEEIKRQNTMDFQKRLEVLSQIILNGTETNKITAIEVMNKMEGIGITPPQNTTVNVATPVLSNMSEADLMKILTGDDE